LQGVAGRLSESAKDTANPFPTTWDFLSRAVWTRDEASGRIRKFPSADIMHDGEPRFEYLKHLTDHRLDHTIAAYEKSRRMLVTWWAVAVYLDDILRNQTHLNAVASDKLEKSAYLLGGDRMEFIYRHIPPVDDATYTRLSSLSMSKDWLDQFKEPLWPDKPKVTFEGKQGYGWKSVRCEETGSSIMAMACGASQMQQFTFSNVLMDEFPRWQWQEESWRNIQPTIQGGGHVDMICTAELGSFAYDILYDRTATE
jgi:hypothetical protein